MKSSFKFTGKVCITINSDSTGKIWTDRCDLNFKKIEVWATCQLEDTGKTEEEYHRHLRMMHNNKNFVPEHSTELPKIT